MFGNKQTFSVVAGKHMLDIPLSQVQETSHLCGRIPPWQGRNMEYLELYDIIVNIVTDRLCNFIWLLYSIIYNHVTFRDLISLQIDLVSETVNKENLSRYFYPGVSFSANELDKMKKFLKEIIDLREGSHAISCN